MVESIGFEGGHDKVICELVFCIHHYGFHRTAIEGALANVVNIFAALAHVNGKCNNLFARGVFEPSDTY